MRREVGCARLGVMSLRTASTASIGAQMPIDWPVAAGLLTLHVGAVAAVLWFSWFALLLALVMLWLTCSLGISLGFHRMLTHKSFQPKRWLKLVLVLLGILALQGRPFFWVGVHRLHHRDPDGALDPHTPRHGFFWSHWGWMLREDTGGPKREQAIHDLKSDRILSWMNRWAPLLQLLSILAIFGVGEFAKTRGVATNGWSCVLWAVALRAVVVYHSTWFVNSAAHRWGYINYRTKDDARNLWWVALLTFGEGWHNNHHAFANSARIGHRWFELDLTWLALRSFSALGLVSSIRLPEETSIRNRRIESTA